MLQKRQSSKASKDNDNQDDDEEHDPTAVLLSVITLMPKITREQLENEWIEQDLLQFLKIVSHQFTTDILTMDDQKRIAFYEPHLMKPDALSKQNYASNSTNTKNKRNRKNNYRPKSSSSFGTFEPTIHSDNNRSRAQTKVNKNRNNNNNYSNNNNYNNNTNYASDNNIDDTKDPNITDDINLNDNFRDNNNNRSEMKDEMLPTPAKKRARIVHRLTAHPSQAPFGSLLTIFEQLLDTQNTKIKKSRVDILNQYGCISSAICKLLHILRYFFCLDLCATIV